MGAIAAAALDVHRHEHVRTQRPDQSDVVADDVDDRIIGRDGVADTEVEDAGAFDSTADEVAP